MRCTQWLRRSALSRSPRIRHDGTMTLRRSSQILVSLVALGSIVGCGTAQRQAMQTERMLAAAGFQMRMQDTASEAQNMAGLPQRELFHQQKDGKTFFIYADDEYCKCVYVGSAEAYRRYEKMAIESKIANAQLRAARAQQSAALSWGAWGPWYRPWY